eukprot:CAMPEP_0170113422 /NCGR_PEP_ID=MMETSP0020_2-20130122/9880_1 /TAXON_ID=98059 /ORGANISM="Dinobryon sp., Strain UTEXLB2267" /LENGTH=165 /DNA_ID=CAMNT_0010339777 /DNA_START=1412 /DNA_END=1909 /DNA_ORIENTATION=-
MTWMAAAITCADITVHACGSSANVDNSWILTGAILEDLPQLTLQIAFAVVNSRSSYLQIVSLIFSGWHIAFIFISLTFVNQNQNNIEPSQVSTSLDIIEIVLGGGLTMDGTLIGIFAVILEGVSNFSISEMKKGYGVTAQHETAAGTGQAATATDQHLVVGPGLP